MPLGEFVEIPNLAALIAAGDRWGYPIMLKAKRNSYDGKGNFPVRSRPRWVLSNLTCELGVQPPSSGLPVPAVRYGAEF